MFISQLLGEACSSVLGIDALKAMRLNMLEIPPEDLDLIVLSHLQQNRINSNVTKKTSYRHVAPLGHIIPIPSQLIFVITPLCCVLSREATLTNFIKVALSA
jgi:hypothetical protein